MSAEMIILAAGPALSVQDFGRTGYLAQGMTRGGAADTLALREGAALLGQGHGQAALEMIGAGGTFEATQDIVIALTGGAMTASIDGAPVVWNASHILPAGAKLKIGGATSGNYSYLHLGGGIDTPVLMGARAAHLNAGLGQPIKTGDRLPILPGNAQTAGRVFAPDNRFDGGVIRIVPSMQTTCFSQATRARFTATTFRRDPRANRMGVRMDQPEDGFFADDVLSIVSEVIVPGDIQITGDGAPFVLMCECQTTGGYPRIGTVIPCDLPRVAQAPAGAEISFEFVTPEDAAKIELRARAEVASLSSRITALVRDPHDIRDLLGYQLVGGAISARADPYEAD
ncbi:MAG: biotin-dependent carboxyltransferase family protein [Sulfitobacter sp.]